jgi:ubiquinone/menaquinone biosynthesis C-methylase UbiE
VDVYEDLYKAKRVKTARLAEPDDFIIDLASVLAERECRRVLDVGCGAGRNALFLAEQGYYVVGVDIASTALKMALRKADGSTLKGCLFIRGTFLKLPFADSQFNAVVSCYSIENQSLSEIRKALNEMKRVLVSRGLVLVTLHSTQHWRFGLGKQISPGTFLTTERIDGKTVRFRTHFFRKEDVMELFHNLDLGILSIKEIIREADKKRAHWITMAEKGLGQKFAQASFPQ